MTEREYNETVTAHADHLYRFLLKNLRHESDAQDLVQSAYEKLWVNHRTIGAEKGKSYLFTVAYHAMIDQVRKEKTRRLFAVPAESEVQPTENRNRILQEALQSLDETRRSLVMLKDYEGYNYAEIGEITGLSESQVKVYLHRARLQLRDYIVRVENII